MAVHISQNNDPRELYMIELQGSVSCSAGLFDDRGFGCIKFNEKGNPELSIGSRILEGKSENLKQPIAVLQKTDHWSPYQGCNDLRSREVDIMGIIKKRLIFSTRPRIISEISGA